MSPLGWCSQELPKAPACPGRGEGRVKLRGSAKQVLSEKSATLPKRRAPLCPHPYPSLLSGLGKSGAFFPLADEEQSCPQAEAAAQSPGLGGGRGRGVPAVGWPLWPQDRDVEGWDGPPRAWMRSWIPHPWLSQPGCSRNTSFLQHSHRGAGSQPGSHQGGFQLCRG